MSIACSVQLIFLCCFRLSSAYYVDTAYDDQISNKRPSNYYDDMRYDYEQEQYDYEQEQYDYEQGQSYRANKVSSQYYDYYQDQETNAAKSGYRYVPAPKKQKPHYVPVVVKKKKKEKKQKILSISKGSYIPGGTQIFGKFRSLKKCMKACGQTPTCFSGDYDPWSGKCYFHGNTTACNTMRSHKKITHFKKAPCEVTDAPRGVVVLGAFLFGGIEQKGIKSLTDCRKKCANAGSGIAPSPMRLATFGERRYNQLCFGLDYDFSSHKCYFHTVLFTRMNSVTLTLCPITIRTPVLRHIDLQPNPSTIHMSLCPSAT